MVRFYCLSIDAVKFSSIFLLFADQFSITCTIYGCYFSFLRILQPQLMGEMISSSLENKSVFFNAVAIVLLSMVSAFAFYFFSLSVSNIGKKISITSCSMFYRKVRES